MTPKALLHPEEVEVNRTELRQNQSAVLRRAKGRRIVVVTARGAREQEKCVVDRQYFLELLRKLRSAAETLEITADRKLFGQILKAAESVDQDARRGKLHSFEEAF